MRKTKGFTKIFISWFSENRSRFVIEPTITKPKNGCLKMTFPGVASEIRVSVYGYGIAVSVDPHGDCWDILKDFDIAPRRNSAGDYYCDMCLPEFKKFYRSRKELLAKHSFEPFMEWINGHFQPDRWVLLFEMRGRWATIVKEGDVESRKQREGAEYFVRAFPVIVPIPHIKLFLDDERTPPEGWVYIRRPEEAIDILKTGKVAEISLDHDLGDDAGGTGYDVLLWIEEAVAIRELVPPRMIVHSANPSARQKMEAWIKSIYAIYEKDRAG